MDLMDCAFLSVLVHFTLYFILIPSITNFFTSYRYRFEYFIVMKLWSYDIDDICVMVVTFANHNNNSIMTGHSTMHTLRSQCIRNTRENYSRNHFFITMNYKSSNELFCNSKLLLKYAITHFKPIIKEKLM